MKAIVRVLFVIVHRFKIPARETGQSAIQTVASLLTLKKVENRSKALPRKRMAGAVKAHQ